jgi:hypothetical protein
MTVHPYDVVNGLSAQARLEGVDHATPFHFNAVGLGQ